MSFLNEWIEQYRSYNRNVRLFLLTNILTQISMGMFMVIYNFYIRDLGFTEKVNGNIIAMTALASAIILIPAGMLSDRVGRKRMMTISVIGSSIIFVERALLTSETSLVFTAFLSGITLALLQVSAIPWLAENSTQKQRIHLFSFHFALMMGANVIGNTAGGGLTDLFVYLFDVSSLWSIRITLFIAAGFFLSGIFPILKMDEQKKEMTKTSVSFASFKKSFFTNRSALKLIGLFTIAQLFIGFGSGLVIPYLNLYFADRFSIPTSLIGVILSFGQAATAVAMIIGPLVVRHVGEVRAVVLLQLSSLPFLLLTAFTQNVWFAAFGFLLRQALMNAGNPIMLSLMMERVSDSMKGLANSVNQMVFQLGWALMGPISTSLVIKFGSYWGYAMVFSITGCLYVTAALYFYFMFRKKPAGSQSIVAKTL